MVFLPQHREDDKQRVFKIPRSTNGYNKALKKWMEDAGIKKHITGHCARHSLGTILKENNLSDLLIADILGHTSTKYVRTYSRMSNLEKKKQGIKAAMSKSDPLL
jgi:integrase